ncbi:MAG: Gfo/Idh/MocA family protein [Candidatus Brocadiia bacterium]
MSVRVAVLGASGFGRHHARWYAELGCEVVAFLGSSPQSVESTARALREAMGFGGRGYTAVDELLAAERPHGVSVCTPAPLHGEHARAALRAGCSVLCEKPFVWRPHAPTDDILAEARELVAAAEDAGLALAVNTQYAAAAEAYRELAPGALEAPRRFTGEMTSQLKPAGPRGRDIWLDLAPHPLSVLLALLPRARLQAGTVRATVGEERTDAHFEVATDAGRCAVAIHVAKLRERPFPRRFGFGRQVADCATEPDDQGVYHGYLRLGDRERRCDDFMRTSIARFCDAVRGQGRPLVDGHAALRNLELMLRVLGEAEGAR